MVTKSSNLGVEGSNFWVHHFLSVALGLGNNLCRPQGPHLQNEGNITYYFGRKWGRNSRTIQHDQSVTYACRYLCSIN